MNLSRHFKHLLLSLFLVASPVAADTVDELLHLYQTRGATAPSSEQGYTQWNKSFTNNSKNEVRSCSTCHTRDLRATGKQANTGKTIKPLAPSVNAQRLTDRKKIEKWFKRNCKWTIGRECNAQEKSDFLAYIRTQ